MGSRGSCRVTSRCALGMRLPAMSGWLPSARSNLGEFLATGAEIRCSAKVLDLFDRRSAFATGVTYGLAVKYPLVSSGLIVKVTLTISSAKFCDLSKGLSD